MFLKNRPNHRVYCYRSCREDGKVRTEYVGAGAFGQVLAEMDAAARTQRRACRARWQEVGQQLQQAHGYIEQFEAGVANLMRDTLVARGYHRPGRGRWRRRRRSVEDATMAQDAASPEDGDSREGKPRYEDHCQVAVDLADVAELACISLLAGTDETLGNSLREKLRTIEADLGIEHSSPLERLLIRRISLSWAQAYHGDLLVTQSEKENLRDAKYVSGWRDRAHRRLMAATETLATVRRLLSPQDPKTEHG